MILRVAESPNAELSDNRKNLIISLSSLEKGQTVVKTSFKRNKAKE